MAATGSTTYTPQQIDAAYGISNISFSGGFPQSSVSGTGAGQTIAIVEAYSDPNIQSDLAAFDAKYGLSAPPSFTVDNLAGSSTDAGWALETSLDVEWAHAIAPQANIVLVEASDASLNSLLNAVSYAANVPNVSVVSMSWGSSEFFGEASDEGVFTTPAGHTNETFVAASGDSGAWSGPTFPSVLPNVLAVGGTTLALGSSGSYGSETGWTDSTGGFSGLDNGFRSGISIPRYQVSTLQSAGLDYGLRTTPDVSYNADPNAGFAVYDSVPYSGSAGWFDVGGTSAAAPAWAGLAAVTDQGLAASGKSTLTTSQLLTDLYSLPSTDFNDITSGFNGYNAGVGYDLVTGLGTPKANLLVSGILGASGVKTSTATTSSTSTSKQATSSSVVHNAVVVAGASTSITSFAGTTVGTVTGFTAGLAALPSQSALTINTAASTGTAAQAGTSFGSSSTTTAVPIGLGQAAYSVAARQLSSPNAPEEPPGATADVIETGRGQDPAPPPSPLPPPTAPEATTPERSPEGAVDPGAVPGSPSADLLPVSLQGLDRNRDEPVAVVPAVWLESTARREEEADAPSGEGGAPGPAAGLVLGGAAIALAHRVVVGPGRRRRPLTAAFRAMVS
jgi:subtilase family serine protease